MKIKNLFLTSLPIFTLSLPLVSHAHDIIIHNNTLKDSTTKIFGMCSNFFKNQGITRAMEKNHIVPDSIVKLACAVNQHHCVADVYMSDNCTGVFAGQVILDTDHGILSVTNSPSSPYSISSGVGSFVVSLNGGSRIAN